MHFKEVIIIQNCRNHSAVMNSDEIEVHVELVLIGRKKKNVDTVTASILSLFRAITNFSSLVIQRLSEIKELFNKEEHLRIVLKQIIYYKNIKRCRKIALTFI